MKLRILILLIVSHLSVGFFGVGIGLYLLPILIAPAAPNESDLEEMSSQAQYKGEFRTDLKDSDAFHWGEGEVSVGSQYITLKGELAPGPDYKLYLSAEFVETEADFKRLKAGMVRVGDVKTFENFVVEVAAGIDPSQFNTVVVWCESFNEFITSAKYR